MWRRWNSCLSTTYLHTLPSPSHIPQHGIQDTYTCIHTRTWTTALHPHTCCSSPLILLLSARSNTEKVVVSPSQCQFYFPLSNLPVSFLCPRIIMHPGISFTWKVTATQQRLSARLKLLFFWPCHSSACCACSRCDYRYTTLYLASWCCSHPSHCWTTLLIASWVVQWLSYSLDSMYFVSLTFMAISSGI